MRSDLHYYLDDIFGPWFKNIVTLLLIVILAVVVILGLTNQWIDKDLGLQIGFLILGAILGAWLSNGK